jgi:hypothetical protein
VLPKSGQFWIIESVGSDVLKGKFQLLKCLNIGLNNSESTFEHYFLDVEAGILTLKK